MLILGLGVGAAENGCNVGNPQMERFENYVMIPRTKTELSKSPLVHFSPFLPLEALTTCKCPIVRYIYLDP